MVAKKIVGKTDEDRVELGRRMKAREEEVRQTIASLPAGAVYRAMKQVERRGMVDGTFPIEGASSPPNDDDLEWWDRDE